MTSYRYFVGRSHATTNGMDAAPQSRTMLFRRLVHSSGAYAFDAHKLLNVEEDDFEMYLTGSKSVSIELLERAIELLSPRIEVEHHSLEAAIREYRRLTHRSR
jgi:hypothetical protein